MAFQPGYKSRLIIGDFAYSTFLRKISTPSTTKMLNTSCFGNQPEAFIPGQTTSTLTADGLLDPDATSNLLVDQLNTWTSEEALLLGMRGFALGNEVQMASVLKTTVAVTAPLEDVVQFNLAAQTNGMTDYGISLHDLTAETTSADGTASDNGALTSNGGVGQLHVTAFSGLTNIIVKIQHSSDNSTFADLITFSTATGITQQRSTAAGTVNQYIRASWAKTGTGSATFACAFARR